jgi:hypothetical protein
MSVPSVTIPSESDDASMQRFLQKSQSAAKVICDSNSAAHGRWFTDVSIPSIQHLNFTGCKSFEQGEKIFSAMPSLIGLSYFPVSMAFLQSVPIIQCLDRCGRWAKLEFLYVHQRPVCSPFDKSLDWPALWKGRNLNFVEMNLHFQSTIDTKMVMQANFPRLERLKISSCLGDQLLDWILASHLPSLQYLDLRFNDVSSTALTNFARVVTARCSNLTEISIDFYDGEKTEYYDWNGAVVQSFDGALSDDHTTQSYLAGTGLRAVPAKTLYF